MEQKDESYYIERILDGATEYFSVFLDRYSRPLYTLVVQIVGQQTLLPADQPM